VIERSQVQYGTTTIPYAIRRTDREKTVALTIEARGKLVVSAPGGVSIDRLNRIVRDKAPWVIRRARRVSDLPPPPLKREFVSGETVLYLGRQYRLRVVEGTSAEARASLQGKWLNVSVPTGLAGLKRRRAVARALVGWLKEHASSYIPGRLETLAKRFGVSVPSLVVREQRRRWGSCDARGTLRINWRIIQAPARLIDYVLAHEVVHLRVPAHGPAFWRELGRAMPDYEERRARLRDLGPNLVW
jgi:predicted metal-dependent hydrolase